MITETFKTRTKPIDNPLHSSLFFRVVSNTTADNYNQKISRQENKGSAVTFRLLQQLKKNKLIKSKRESKQIGILNKNYYYVNWSVVVKKLILQSIKTLEENIKQYRNYSNETTKRNHIRETKTKILTLKKMSKEYQKNKKIHSYLEKLFKNIYLNKKTDYPISYVFNSLILFHKHNSNNDLNKTLSEDDDIKSFLYDISARKINDLTITEQIVCVNQNF